MWNHLFVRLRFLASYWDFVDGLYVGVIHQIIRQVICWLNANSIFWDECIFSRLLQLETARISIVARARLSLRRVKNLVDLRLRVRADGDKSFPEWVGFHVRVISNPHLVNKGRRLPQDLLVGREILVYQAFSNQLQETVPGVEHQGIALILEQDTNRIQ